MEQNKIENDFRQKLNQREIKPSEKAWDRLDAMLAVAEGKKSKPKYSWMHIAASLLGLLFIGTIFLMQTEEVVDVRRNDVVLENATVKKSSEGPAAIENNVSASESVAIVKPATVNSKINEKSTIVKSTISNPKTQHYVAENQSINNNQSTNQKSIIHQKTEQQITTAKVDELLAAVNPETAASQKSSPEVDAPGQVKQIKVNPNTLLSQVDGELNVSFREKVIKNFKTAKVAVANRNLIE